MHSKELETFETYISTISEILGVCAQNSEIFFQKHLGMGADINNMREGKKNKKKS